MRDPFGARRIADTRDTGSRGAPGRFIGHILQVAVEEMRDRPDLLILSSNGVHVGRLYLYALERVGHVHRLVLAACRQEQGSKKYGGSARDPGNLFDAHESVTPVERFALKTRPPCR